jgi:hypothetical protein
MVLLLVLGAALVFGAQTAWAGENFVAAPLKGRTEVPAVDSQGTGVATFKLRDEGLKFKVNVANLDDVVAAHIHCAPAGVNGPVAVTLFAGGPVTPHGTLAQGVITAPDAGNLCGFADLDDLVAALQSGDTYVNVHTLANPGGEIRGQVR